MENRANYNTKPSPNNKQVMYYTKRSRGVGVPLSEGPHRRSLSSRQSPPSLPCTAQFEVGAFYQIDHKQLPPRSPIHLKSIRVVKVCEKTSFCVTVSFPSDLSLRNFFSRLRLRSAVQNNQAVQEPEMDERYVMSSNQASKILRTKVPLSVFYKESSMDNFWLLNPVAPSPPLKEEISNKRAFYNLIPGSCLLTLRRHTDLRWGIRRRVKYVGMHNGLPDLQPLEEEEVSTENANVSENNKVPDLKEPEVNVRDERDESEEEEEEQKKVALRVKTELPSSSKKRKREMGSGSRIKRMKRREKEKKRMKRIEKKKKKKRGPPVHGQGEIRWSAQRYKTAEQSLLQVMKEIGANSDKPVLRNDLREEARQFIGDTGLLDHLLKHMAGKVLADGDDRFVRRHNSEGNIEYWLEPAELAEIRRQAGITDQLWLPPPGWKPGDPVARCTCCRQSQLALEIGAGQLKDEIFAHVKRQLEEQNVKLTSEQNEKMQALMQLQPVDNSLKENYERLLIQNAKLQEQITALSVSLLSVKDEMQALKEEKEKTQLHGSDNYANNNNNNMALAVRENKKQQIGVGVGVASLGDNKKTTSSTTEGRRSGFRVCKPEGTFLWPNMAAPSNSFSNNNNNNNINYFNNGCPTPPSTSSATSTPSKFLLLPSPTSLPSPVAFSNNNNNVMMDVNVGRRQIRGEGIMNVGDEMLLGTAPETDSEGDVLTDLALATLSY